MRAVVFHQFGQPAQLETVPDPTPSPDGVVIAVRASGLCRSDWHGWMGHDPTIALPHVPGHEFAGEIVAVGRNVRNWAVGTRVTVPFVCGCGQCPPCRAGEQQICDDQFQPGFTAWGSFAEFVAIDRAEQNLVALPAEMSFVTAASLGCRFATAFRAVVDQGRLSAGQWVAVHGCGGVGLSAISIARAMGAQIIAVDITAERLERAKQLGADYVINGSSGGDVVAAVRELSRGGVHLSLDALGSPETCFNSVANLRKQGKHLQIGLLLAAQKQPPLPMDLVIANELQIIGSHGMQAHRYPAMLDLIASGRVDPSALLGDTIPLEAAPAALSDLANFRGAGITVIDLS